MKKISVVGAGGMAGHLISTYLAETGRYLVQKISHSAKLASDWILLDVEQPGEVAGVIVEFSPDVVINCVGLLVKDSELNPGMAAYLNGYFPHFLERRAAEKGFKLIHLSTDCVFSGDKGNYLENDSRDGRGFYAQSKAMGEVHNAKDLTIRTSIIGPELKKDASGLFHWIMTNGGTVKGFDKVIWNGITTLELAKSLETFIGNNTVGVCHLSTSEKISKYDLLRLIVEIWGKDASSIIRDSNLFCDKTLSSTRSEPNINPPGYRQQLSELKAWMVSHKSIYGQYFK